MKRRNRFATLLVLALATATVAVISGSAGASPAPENAFGTRAEHLTEQRTLLFQQAFEQRDLATLSTLLAPAATLVYPFTSYGTDDPETRYTGEEQVLAYFRQVFTVMGRIKFVDEKLSVVAVGQTSFLQANGDFTTVDGRPYRNVYVFRLDWNHGHVVSIEEYADPIKYSNTFPN